MYEANLLASEIVDFLNVHNFKDGGARYRILVTDTAGNYAEIRTLKFGDRERWAMEEGVDIQTLRERVRELWNDQKRS